MSQYPKNQAAGSSNKKQGFSGKSKPGSGDARNKGKTRHAKSDRKGGRNYQDEFAKSEYKKGERAEFSKEEKYPISTAMHKNNDPQWYFKDAQTLQDYASFTFSRPLGAALPPSKITNFKDSAYWTIPGLLVMRYLPTVGLATDAQSPINLAAQNVYTRVRYKNSGRANYDVPDLMLYYVAATQLYSMWNWMKRIYGYASEYAQNNWYKARAYAYAEGVNLEDIVNNLSNFRGYLNITASRINVFAVPAIFNYTVRQSWLVSNIYKDSNTSKAQEYMFSPVCFYQYDETSSPQGGILVPVDIALNETNPIRHTYSSLVAKMNAMINAMQYSEDVGNMSGDTLKEFEGKLCYLSQIEPDYKVTAVYNEEVLMQIENAVFVANWQNRPMTQDFKSRFTIRQNPNTNFITTNFQFLTNDSSESRQTHEYNFHKDSPSPEDLMVASRFNVDWTLATTSEGKVVTITECGSEVMLQVDFIVYTTGGLGSTFTNAKDLKLSKLKMSTIWLGQRDTVQANRDDNDYIAAELFCWNAFDWAPPLYMITVRSDGKVVYPVLRDWDIYTSLTMDNIKSLNLLAVQSLFDVPYSN